jgi:hypothetical protein
LYRENDLKLRLFMSADMIGSTVFKQNLRGESNPLEWRETVLEFLVDFPAILEARCRALATPAIPRLYKSIGDELVFVVTLEASYREAAGYIAAFAETLTTFITDRERPAVKGSAWLAAFPLGNMEISVEKQGTAKVDGVERAVEVSQVEYIGVQMDIGFRVARFASAMRLALTVDLALLLLTAKLNGVAAALALRFQYDGRETLKGVLAERPYPIVSILIAGSEDYIELRLRGKMPHECAGSADLLDLADLCRRFIAAGEPLLFLPYLAGCDTFGKIPTFHQSFIT